ncbi:UDP-N-acetyl-D-glucosamine 2-epimerase [Oleiphilus messinensis]|uniref:UDP-N-acetyl-D-glucosamine 2-epimerase n=1 Tax=Oleiphilus messinensis TaxID=141451 RepID=A0A1Y0IHE5_9GAMM|nr:UDP-N-acetylglucosamine 2-epimerase [Oleiphilus messinensis]ARU59559.1 UDP-N-acetyl-D-glucosamine 2-epimerase [Oleiphilus messinensis]
MRVGILTSSRADYSQYLPLLRQLDRTPEIDFEIIAFGTHLSDKFGKTIKQIVSDGFEVCHGLDTYVDGDRPQSICESMSKTILACSEVWEKTRFDLIYSLGDRFEMFAACSSLQPYNIPIAHIHGGEETEGAIDNAFRHGITHMSSLHFPSTEVYRQRIVDLKGSDSNVYNVGALSIDNLSKLKLLSKSEFFQAFNINLDLPSVLVTFHPETINFKSNQYYVEQLTAVLSRLKKYQIIITMPNADTSSAVIRDRLNAFIVEHENAVGVESFGTLGYLTCIKHCAFMLGNTSSGFLEASYFPTKVVNLGNRQKGRILTANIVTVEIEESKILQGIDEILSRKLPEKIDIFGHGNAAEKIVAATIAAVHNR